MRMYHNYGYFVLAWAFTLLVGEIVKESIRLNKTKIKKIFRFI